MDFEKYFCPKTNQSITGHFKNVQDMVAHLQPVVTESSKAPVYFRGQVYPWRLTSSLHRSQNPSVDIKETEEFISWLRSNKYICKEESEIDDNFLMAVAQHYGYKTDFIDFTTDLEVAAYFATDYKTLDELPDRPCGCIWCVSQEEIQIMQEIFWHEVNQGMITDGTVIEKFKRWRMVICFGLSAAV